jgi:hypothetical protein
VVDPKSISMSDAVAFMTGARSRRRKRWRPDSLPRAGFSFGPLRF